MIYFPAPMTPVPNCPGYFWDTAKHKLFSVKIGGVLRELKLLTAHPAMFRYGKSSWLNMQAGDRYYRVSVNGRNRYLPLHSLKTLEIVDYDMPVVERAEVTDEN